MQLAFYALTIVPANESKPFVMVCGFLVQINELIWCGYNHECPPNVLNQKCPRNVLENLIFRHILNYISTVGLSSLQQG